MMARLSPPEDVYKRQDHAQVAILNQQAAVNAFEIETRDACRPLAAGQNADVLLGRRHLQEMCIRDRSDAV